MPPNYLAGYLGSALAQRLLAPAARGTIPRIRPESLRDLPVPVPGLEAPTIFHAVQRIDEAVAASATIAAELTATRDALFDAASPVDMATALTDAANAARAISAALARQSDPAGRLRDVLPYPVARALRTWKITENPKDRYEAMLGIAEAVAVTLGVIGLAWCRHTGVEPDVRRQWVRAVHTSGVSLGHWVDVAEHAAIAARQVGDHAGGFADALRTRRGNRGLLPDLRPLVTERNDARHGGAGPRSRAEAQDRLQRYELNLNGVIDQLSFLAGTPFRLVESITRDHATGLYAARTLRLVGDHPDFEPETIPTPDGLFDGLVYVEFDTDRLLNLDPFCVWSDCPQCLRPEVYYLDRIRNDRTARFRSFDRGHLHESDAAAETLHRSGFSRLPEIGDQG